MILFIEQEFYSNQFFYILCSESDQFNAQIKLMKKFFFLNYLDIYLSEKELFSLWLHTYKKVFSLAKTYRNSLLIESKYFVKLNLISSLVKLIITVLKFFFKCIVIFD